MESFTITVPEMDEQVVKSNKTLLSFYIIAEILAYTQQPGVTEADKDRLFGKIMEILRR